MLSDEGARKAYDNVLKAKQAAQIRNRQLDEKRKKLKDDLDAREAAAADREQGIFSLKKRFMKNDFVICQCNGSI